MTAIILIERSKEGEELEKFAWVKNGKQECQCHTSNTRHAMAIVVAKQFYLRRVRTVWNGCKSIAIILEKRETMKNRDDRTNWRFML